LTEAVAAFSNPVQRWYLATHAVDAYAQLAKAKVIEAVRKLQNRQCS
jgi:hypothetical protein